MNQSRSTQLYNIKYLLIILVTLLLSGCQSMYYNAMEKVGYEKRDILVDRVDDARDSQQEAKQQFESALEQFVAVTNYSGGDLEAQYKKLKSEYEDSKARADEVSDRIESVEHVANALFAEWEKELSLYSNKDLRKSSAKKLSDTRASYSKLVRAMKNAEKKIKPVLDAFNDRVLYLKHNLNANAISSLSMQKRTVENEIKSLIKDMNASIDAADKFISSMSE